MEILIQFIFKLIDNALSTCKTIFISRGNNFLAALFAATANFFYLKNMQAAVKSDSDILLYALCLAVFIGVYLPGKIISKTQRDSLYIYNITADNMDNGKLFADKVRELNIPIKTYKAYDSNMCKTLSCEIYCLTREESKQVECLLLPNFKYNVSVPVKS